MFPSRSIASLLNGLRAERGEKTRDGDRGDRNRIGEGTFGLAAAAAAAAATTASLKAETAAAISH